MLSINKSCNLDTNIQALVDHCETLQLTNNNILNLVQFYINYPELDGKPATPPNIKKLKDRYKNHRKYVIANVLQSVEFNFRDYSTYYLCTYCGEKVNNSIEMTLDHFRPKHSHPEYAVYTKNLIPTCNACNTLYKKNKINSATIDIPYPVEIAIIPEKFDIKLQLDIDQVNSDPVKKNLKFILAPKVPNPLFDTMIKELKLESRLNKALMAKKYHFLKSIQGTPLPNQDFKINESKIQYREEGDIPMHLLADCLTRISNLDYIRNNNYYI